MKILLFLVSLLFSFSLLQAQDSTAASNSKNTQQMRFVDEDGDGYNDLAPDHDGDGIPNGLDPDYAESQRQRHRFIDLNGDGIDDSLQDDDMGRNRQRIGEENPIGDPSSGQSGKKKQKGKGRP